MGVWLYGLGSLGVFEAARKRSGLGYRQIVVRDGKAGRIV